MGTGFLFDIQRFSIHDGPGIRTTVFFKGCPLACWWCHNPESQSGRPELLYRADRCVRCGDCVETCPAEAVRWADERPQTDPGRCRGGAGCGAEGLAPCVTACPAGAREVVGQAYGVEDVLAQVRRDTPFYDESGGGVTFSGGEPLAQSSFLTELLECCGAEEIHRAVDTTGFAPPATFERIARRTDLFLYDLKLIDPERHRRYTGQSNEPILENLAFLDREGIPAQIRVPVIPGINDDNENVEATAAHLAGLRTIRTVTLLPHHRPAMDKYARIGKARRLPPTPAVRAGRLEEIAGLFRQQGLEVYDGSRQDANNS